MQNMTGDVIEKGQQTFFTSARLQGCMLVYIGRHTAERPETIQYRHKSFHHKRETVISSTECSGKVTVCLFPSSNSIMRCVKDQVKCWLKMFAWANICGERAIVFGRVEQSVCWTEVAGREHYALGVGGTYIPDINKNIFV